MPRGHFAQMLGLPQMHLGPMLRLLMPHLEIKTGWDLARYTRLSIGCTRLGAMDAITQLGAMDAITRLGAMDAITRLGAMDAVTQLGAMDAATQLGAVASMARTGWLPLESRSGVVPSLESLGRPRHTRARC